MTRLLLVALPLLAAAPLPAQSPDSLAHYTRIVEQNPDDSRAVYRLATLQPRGSDRAITLFQRYTALEPDDAWGHLALAEALATAGRFDEAAASVRTARGLAPGEEDVDAVDARVRRAARAVAPSVQPRVSFTRDSDGNTLLQLGLAGEVASSATTRWGVSAALSSVADDFEELRAEEARATLGVRSRAVRFELAAGALRVPEAADFTTAVGRVRLRWQPSPASGLVDVRLTRAPVLVSPLLALNRVVVSEARATLELPVAGPLRARGLGQVADLAADEFGATSHNTRIGAGGALVVRAAPVTEIAATFYRLSYEAPTTAGYFAPRVVQVAELGSYAEVYRFDPLSIAFDLGAGMQRVAEHGEPPGDWSFVARGWSQLSLPFSGRVELQVEAEAYRSQLQLVATSRSWSSVSTAISLRWLL